MEVYNTTSVVGVLLSTSNETSNYISRPRCSNLPQHNAPPFARVYTHIRYPQKINLSISIYIKRYILYLIGVVEHHHVTPTFVQRSRPKFPRKFPSMSQTPVMALRFGMGFEPTHHKLRRCARLTIVATFAAPHIALLLSFFLIRRPGAFFRFTFSA